MGHKRSLFELVAAGGGFHATIQIDPAKLQRAGAEGSAVAALLRIVADVLMGALLLHGVVELFRGRLGRLVANEGEPLLRQTQPAGPVVRRDGAIGVGLRVVSLLSII